MMVQKSERRCGKLLSGKEHGAHLCFCLDTVDNATLHTEQALFEHLLLFVTFLQHLSNTMSYYYTAPYVYPSYVASDLLYPRTYMPSVAADVAAANARVAAARARVETDIAVANAQASVARARAETDAAILSASVRRAHGLYY